MKLLLTSTGLKSLVLQEAFLKNTKKEVEQLKVIFVPTAANDEESKAMLPSCKADLTNLGILESNILVYDLDYILPYETGAMYDAIYFCGGSTKYLLERINAIGFSDVLRKLLDQGMLFIGVSAGSKICGDNYSGNLGYLHRNIELHCSQGSPFGKVVDNGTIYLTDTQALSIDDDAWIVIGE